MREKIHQISLLATEAAQRQESFEKTIKRYEKRKPLLLKDITVCSDIF
jgi:hypothetical protein